MREQVSSNGNQRGGFRQKRKKQMKQEKENEAKKEEATRVSEEDKVKQGATSMTGRKDII